MIYSICLLLCLASFATAQPDTLWTLTINGPGDFYPSAIRQIQNGDYYVTGSSNAFESGTSDGYLARVSGDGHLLWERAYDFGGDESLLDAALLPDGGLLSCGYLLTFNPIAIRMLIIRTDSAGDTLWTRAFGSDSAYASGATCGIRQDGFWAAGYEQTDEYTAGLLVTFDQNGDTVFTRRYPGLFSFAQISAGMVTPDNRYLFVGQTHSESEGDAEVWIMLTDTNGHFSHQEINFAEGEDLLFSIDRLTNGDYIFGGLTTSEDEDGDFLAIYFDYNANPFQAWNLTYGEMHEEEHGHDVAATSDGGFLFGGHAHEHEGSVEEQYRILKAASNGELEWEIMSGDEDNEVINSVEITDDGGFVIAGLSLSAEHSAEIDIIKYGPITGADEPAPKLPAAVKLYPAYPNPFNPTTTIRFAIANPIHVRLAIFDVTGKLVKLAADEIFRAGEYTITFDGTELPSGIYFARIETPLENQTTKLMLLK